MKKLSFPTVKLGNFICEVKLDMNFDYLFRSSYMPV